MDEARTNPQDFGTDAAEPFDTLAAALFCPMGVDGVFARTSLFEDVADGLSRLITSCREPDTEVLRFPPVMSRQQLERSGYLKSFPNLLGCVCGLHGSEAEIRAAADRFERGGDWTSSLVPGDLVLSPAACYPVYPLAAGRGPVPRGGLQFDVVADCFRREPSRQLSRLQSFRMREYVRIGTPDEVADFRERWIERAQRLAGDLGLDRRVVPANDPFFGRLGQVMAIAQLQQALKFELVVPTGSPPVPTACMSFNCHLDHFTSAWGLRNAAGTTVHTACVAFGIDRLALALFCRHGIMLRHWPAAARRALSL
jgi:seryl-tRNA synthetase